MARPDTDDGWIKMAHELDAALAFADFTKVQAIILHYVRAQAFGPAKARVVDLSPSELAKLTDIDKGSIGHGITGLVSDGVLIKTALCRYAFVKNYEAWRKGDKPRFKPSEIGFIKGAPGRAMAFKSCLNSLADEPTEPVGQPTNIVGQRANGVGPSANGGVGQRANDSLVNEPTISASPQTPLYGRENRETDQTGRAGGIKDSDSEDFRRPADPETDARVDGFKAIFDAAVQEFGDQGARWVASYGHELTGDPDLWVKAIRECGIARRAGVHVRSIGGFVRQKHDALKAGPAPELKAYGGGRPTDSEPYLPKFDMEALRAKRQRDREKLAATQAAERAAADAC